MNGLRSSVIEKHKQEYFNNPTINVFNDKIKSGLQYYTLDELKNVNSNWFPLCCYIDKTTEQLVYGGSDKIVHTYVEGETGSGKTTRVIMQSLRALATMDNGNSFIVVDPFGEIFENSFQYLRDLGYNIKVLNCDNPNKSDTYNPLYAMAKETYENQEISVETMNQLKKISLTIEPIDHSDDPIWSQGACSYVNGIMLDLFEQLAKRNISPSQVNIFNIIQRHYWIRQKVVESGERNINCIPHYRNKSRDSLSLQKIISVTNNADKTRDSYFGVVENNLDNYNQKGMFQLSSNSTINVNELIEKPTVIFVQSGTCTVGDDLVALLVNDTYNAVAAYGKKHRNKRMPRNIHCFLDEFANCEFGTGEEFIKMLTTSRKFGMYWHMYLQCDAQIDKKFYSSEIGNIIRANTTEIFMGSQDYRTIERFSVSCGERTIESLNSRLYQNDMNFENVRLINVDKLQKLPEGYVYVKMNKKDILYSYYEAFYKCKEFEDNNLSLDDMYPNNNFDYKKTLCLPLDTQEKEKMKKEKFDNKFISFLKSNLKWMETESGTKILVVDYSARDLDMIFCSDSVENDFYKESDLKAFLEKKQKVEEGFQREMLMQLDEHISKKVIEYGICNYIEIINKFTSIPNYMKERYKFVNNGQIIIMDSSIKYEIIEAYVVNNDFYDEFSFHEKIQTEVDEIVNLNLFPEFILEEFKKTCEEIEEFTFENFKELKTMLMEEE